MGVRGGSDPPTPRGGSGGRGRIFGIFGVPAEIPVAGNQIWPRKGPKKGPKPPWGPIFPLDRGINNGKNGKIAKIAIFGRSGIFRAPPGGVRGGSGAPRGGVLGPPQNGP